MPTYEYECQTCGIHFDKRQNITDEPLCECPECQGPVRRVLHPVGVVFKGSGWYCTDHRSSSSASSSPAKEKDSGNGSTAKTEKKEEAKAEKKEAPKAADQST